MEVEYSNNEGPIAYEVRYACSLQQQPHLKEQLYQQMDDNKSDDEIFDIIEKYFYDDKKLKEIIKNAYDSLPLRIQKVIDKRGDDLSI